MDFKEVENFFFLISGGKTEYIVTIACVIGKSRMKGARVVTNLLPYGAEKPRQVNLKKNQFILSCWSIVFFYVKKYK